MSRSPDENSLAARLATARARRGMDGPPPGDQTPAGPTPWGMAARVGVEMLSALLVGLAIGWALDRWLHTRPIFLALFMLLGGAAGVANVWRMLATPKR